MKRQFLDLALLLKLWLKFYWRIHAYCYESICLSHCVTIVAKSINFPTFVKLLCIHMVIPWPRNAWSTRNSIPKKLVADGSPEIMNICSLLYLLFGRTVTQLVLICSGWFRWIYLVYNFMWSSGHKLCSIKKLWGKKETRTSLYSKIHLNNIQKVNITWLKCYPTIVSSRFPNF